MANIALKTVNVVPNLDAINNRDSNAWVFLDFRITNLRYNYRIAREILNDNGETILENVIPNVHGNIDEAAFQNFWTNYNTPIQVADDLNDSLRAFFIYVLKTDLENKGYFGLTATDWVEV